MKGRGWLLIGSAVVSLAAGSLVALYAAPAARKERMSLLSWLRVRFLLGWHLLGYSREPGDLASPAPLDAWLLCSNGLSESIEFAASQGNAAVVRLLLESKCDGPEVRKSLAAALREAVTAGHIEVAGLLLKEGRLNRLQSAAEALVPSVQAGEAAIAEQSVSGIAAEDMHAPCVSSRAVRAALREAALTAAAHGHTGILRYLLGRADEPLKPWFESTPVGPTASREEARNDESQGSESKQAARKSDSELHSESESSSDSSADRDATGESHELSAAALSRPNLAAACLMTSAIVGEPHAVQFLLQHCN